MIREFFYPTWLTFALCYFLFIFTLVFICSFSKYFRWKLIIDFIMLEKSRSLKKKKEKKKVEVLVTQLHLTLCDSMDLTLPGSSVHGILQAKIVDCVAILFSRGSSQPRDWTRVFYIPGRFFTIWTTGEALYDAFPQP